MPYSQYSEPALALLLLSILPLGLLATWRGRVLSGRASYPYRRAVGEVAIVAYLVVVVGVTLFGPEASGRAVDLDVLSGDVSSDSFRKQMIGNILLFVPLGICIGLARPEVLRPRWIAPLAMSAPVLAEAAQYISNSGRVASVQDVVLGAVGAALGMLVARLLVTRWAFLRTFSAADESNEERPDQAALPAA